jgi:hypothetical protein
MCFSIWGGTFGQSVHSSINRPRHDPVESCHIALSYTFLKLDDFLRIQELDKKDSFSKSINYGSHNCRGLVIRIDMA